MLRTVEWSLILRSPVRITPLQFGCRFYFSWHIGHFLVLFADISHWCWVELLVVCGRVYLFTLHFTFIVGLKPDVVFWKLCRCSMTSMSWDSGKFWFHSLFWNTYIRFFIYITSAHLNFFPWLNVSNLLSPSRLGSFFHKMVICFKLVEMDNVLKRST